MALNFKLNSKKGCYELHFNYDPISFNFRFSLIKIDGEKQEKIDFDPLEYHELRSLIQWLSNIEEHGMKNIGETFIEIQNELNKKPDEEKLLKS